MRFRMVLHPLPRRWRDGRSWLLAAATVALTVEAAAFVPSPKGARIPGLWLPPCLFRSVTEIPCPLCGSTTAAAYLVRGDFTGAWRASALAPFLAGAFVLAVAYCFGLRLAAGRRVELETDRAARRTLWLAGAAIVVGTWGVNLLRHFA